ncbi:MAG: glycosyl transferase group 1 [Bacteroidetes bacterium]|nr:glycosyl transferase group 1 [Bacteroidota bacterium]
MKILFLTSRVPYPPHRGDKLKIWNLMKELSARHSIILITFVASRHELQWKKHLSEVCEEMHFVHLPVWRSVLNCVAASWRQVPFQVAYYSSSRMDKLVREVLMRSKPDVIHTHLIRMAQYTHAMSDRPRVLDLTDAVSLYLERILHVQKNPIARMAIKAELKRMTKYERILEDYNIALVCSQVDKTRLLQSAPKSRIELMHNGVDLNHFVQKNSLQTDEARIIFTGNMSYYPNRDAARYFAETIFPLVREKIPKARFWIVGQNPPRKITSLSAENITVTGFVEDIAAEYLKSAVAVSPVRFGAGTPTSIGVQGLNLEENKEVFVADDPVKFAESIIRLLQDPVLRRESGQRAMQSIRSRFGWNKIALGLERTYREIIEGKA